MTLAERFPALLLEPEYATADLYENPPLGQAFLMVTFYAAFSSFHSLVSAAARTESVSFSLLTFFMTFFLAYVFWFFLSVVLHVVSDLLGGLGELPNAFAFTGLATAPLVVTSVVHILVTLGVSIALEKDAEDVVQYISFGINLIGIGWGWTGVLCYFGLKNAERLESFKAMLVSLTVFFFMGIVHVVYSGFF
jgi:hypothetical protein